MATTINAGTSTSGAAVSADTTGILQLQSGSTPTTAVTIDTSFLVATLTAAIQELKAELDTVKTELATLKGASNGAA